MDAGPDEKGGGAREHTLATRFFVIGCILLATAIGFGIWGFLLGCLIGSQPYILQFFLPLAAGFAAWTFSGSVTAKVQGWVPGIAIAAAGGFGVWAISQYYLIPKQMDECQKHACTSARPCLDVTRLVDFSASGCEADGRRRDIEVIDDKIELLPHPNDQSEPYLASATVLDGQSVEVYDVERSVSRPVKPTVSSSKEIEVLRFPISVNNGFVRIRFVWKNANQKDQGIAFFPPTPYRIKSLTLMEPVVPHGVEIDPKSIVFSSPDGNVDRCSAATLRCTDILATGIDIGWDWNLWAGCSRPA